MMSPINKSTSLDADWHIVRRLLPYLWVHRYRVFLALVLLVLARLANVSVPLVLKQIIENLENMDKLLTIPLALLVAYGLLRFSSILFNELRNIVFTKAGIDINRYLSLVVFSHLHALSLEFHLDRKTGALSRNIDRGNRAITNFLNMVVFNIIPVIVEITLVMVILYQQLDLRYVVTTMVMIVFYVLFTFWITRWRVRFRVEMNESDAAASTRILDSLINYETVKVFGNENREKLRYEQSLKDLSIASYRNSLSLSLLNAGQGLIIVIGLTVLMVMAADGVKDGSLSIGDFVMVNAFLIQMYIPLNFIGSVYRELSHSLIDMEQMFKLLDQTSEVEEMPGARPLKLSKGDIEFRNISFNFLKEKTTLKDISFTVPGGGMVAVVGPSGSGKSTLARLLLRFYDPDQGQIYIDGQNIRTLTLSSLRAVMGVVPQDTVLFNDTIRYNIGYGHAEAGMREIQEAAKVARIHDFITQHPHGYDALVGERGLKLSGGEKQRVAIARVVIKGARILVFDEATSSLDSRSEKAIQEALEHVAEQTTTLVIAHRLSTVVSANEIIVLEHGIIVERGVHAELVSRGGLYAQMWALQQQF